ncbi:MAG: hypothetical protein R6U87_08795 [Thiohalospira sp.]
MSVGDSIGSIVYDARRSGGFKRLGPTRSKIEPVINELLQNVERP